MSSDCSCDNISPQHSDFRANFDAMVEKVRVEIVSSFSDLMRVLEGRKELLLRQLDRFSELYDIFPSHSCSDQQILSGLLSELGLNRSSSSQPLYTLKFNLDPNITSCLRNIGLLQVTLADALSLPVRKVITSQKKGYTPYKVSCQTHSVMNLTRI